MIVLEGSPTRKRAHLHTISHVVVRKIELLFTDEEDICNAMAVITGHCSSSLNNISILLATMSHVEARNIEMPCNDGHALLLFCRHGLRQSGEQFYTAFCHNLII